MKTPDITVKTVAEWMLDEIQKDGSLYQEQARAQYSREIRREFRLRK